MTHLLSVVLAGFLGAVSLLADDDPTLTFYVQLVRGTDAVSADNPRWRPVGPKLNKALHRVFRWANYPDAWTTVEFGPYFLNSTIVTATTVIGGTATGLLVAYGFARVTVRLAVWPAVTVAARLFQNSSPHQVPVW